MDRRLNPNATGLSDLSIIDAEGVRHAVHAHIIFNFPGLREIAGHDGHVLHLRETTSVVGMMIMWMYGHPWAGVAKTGDVAATLDSLIRLGILAEVHGIVTLKQDVLGVLQHRLIPRFSTIDASLDTAIDLYHSSMPGDVGKLLLQHASRMYHSQTASGPLAVVNPGVPNATLIKHSPAPSITGRDIAFPDQTAKTQPTKPTKQVTKVSKKAKKDQAKKDSRRLRRTAKLLAECRNIQAQLPGRGQHIVQCDSGEMQSALVIGVPLSDKRYNSLVR